MNVLKFMQVIFGIHCQSKDMAEFYYLQGKLETRDLNRFLIIYGKNPLLRTTNFQPSFKNHKFSNSLSMILI